MGGWDADNDCFWHKNHDLVVVIKFVVDTILIKFIMGCDFVKNFMVDYILLKFLSDKYFVKQIVDDNKFY